MTAPTFPNVLVVGMHFRGAEAKATVASFVPPVELQLEREPQNPYDEFAIQVFYEGQHIGYVERGKAAFISPQMDEGQKYICTVEELTQRNNNLHPVCTIEPDYRPDESDEEIDENAEWGPEDDSDSKEGVTVHDEPELPMEEDSLPDSGLKEADEKPNA